MEKILELITQAKELWCDKTYRKIIIAVVIVLVILIAVF